MTPPLYNLARMELSVKKIFVIDNDKSFTYRIDNLNRDNQDLQNSIIKQKLALMALNDWENITKVLVFNDFNDNSLQNVELEMIPS